MKIVLFIFVDAFIYFLELKFLLPLLRLKTQFLAGALIFIDKYDKNQSLQMIWPVANYVPHLQESLRGLFRGSAPAPCLH